MTVRASYVSHQTPLVKIVPSVRSSLLVYKITSLVASTREGLNIVVFSYYRLL